ncbi:hypothetical protein CRG98_012755 [Punica granatum]|uniref:Helitron helicase-like domain-containing protein n=1 Tax=Punica granatum TaxID=22663 RepID=A0A2I0KEF1_PUNGR|nr:hypothetical protein CRG98_012755 [Punica granatum]
MTTIRTIRILATQVMNVKIVEATCEDRPDIKTRVFKMKLDQLMRHMVEGQPFGKVVAVIYTIEFQKRRLPRAHILLWLDQSNKFPTPADIDRIISVELPSEKDDPAGFNAVVNS